MAFLAIDLLFAPIYLAGLEASDASLEWIWDLNSERSLATWYSSMQLALAGGVLLALLAARPRKLSSTFALLAAGGGLLFLSVDELVGLHERFAELVEELIGDRRQTGLNRSGAWVLFVGPAFLAGCIAAAYLARGQLRRRPRAARLFAAGVIVLGTSFAGLELLANFVAKDVHLHLLVPVEEVGEMIGATLLLWAVYELMRYEGLILLVPASSDDETTLADG